MEKTVVVILNSTPGQLALLLERSDKRPSYLQFSIEGLKQICLSNLERLNAAQVNGLAEVFDQLSFLEKESLRNAFKCDIQMVLDDAVCSYLEFDKEICETARHLLAKEPIINGETYDFSFKALA